MRSANTNDPSPSAETPSVRPPRNTGVRSVATPSRSHASAYAIHDANNLLAAITANIQFLRSIVGEDVRGLEAREALDDLEQCRQRIGVLLREALDSASGRSIRPDAPSRLLVAAVVADAVAATRQRARIVGIDVRPHLATSALIEGDRTTLLRVLENLLDNALRYSKPGDAIDVGCVERDGWVEITVSDQGVGVPDELREKIFEPFFTTGTTRDGEREAHTGLGLAFCDAAVRSHGGGLELRAGQARGACFVIHLPVAGNSGR